MNYIHKLQDENTMLKERLCEIAKQRDHFYGFLFSQKFVGVESDGSRKDWIATGDVARFLNEINTSTI